MTLEIISNPKLEELGDLRTVYPDVFPSSKGGVEIVVIGLGGTGGYLVRDLCRFLYSLKTRNYQPNHKISLTLIDGDKVEEKNLLRQNFFENDLGLFKAEALAKKHSYAFGLEVSYVNEFITEENIYSILPFNFSQKIIITCVDNNKTRRLINSKIRDYAYVYWIDSGNERSSGQVICGNNTDKFYSPDFYPDILDETKDSKTQISCAERMMADEQNLFVNTIAAGNCLMYLRKILLGEAIYFPGIEFNIHGSTTLLGLKENKDK